MTISLALLQAASQPDRSLFMYLGVITLATLVALGWRFFINMKEVLFAPSASLKHHGMNDNFFFSLVVVFLGGVIGAFVLLLNQPTMVSGYHQAAQVVATGLAQTAPNPTYRPVAEQWALGKIDAAFNVFFINNMIFFPLLLVGFWLLIGSVAYVGARMFGGHAAYGPFLGTLAYSYFFGGIGLGCLTAAIFNSATTFKDVLAGGMPPTDAWTIAGGVLLLYGIVLFCMGVMQAADLTTGQMIGALVVLLIVVGGGSALGYFYGAAPKYQTFASQMTTFDPSKQGYTIPQ
jgi:hypothetical protein